MANEIRGALSEAAVVAALELVDTPYRARTAWGETPAGLLVCESDVTIFRGRKLDGIIQVTSSGYAGNYQMKFWRDLGELFEIRRVYPEIAVINVIFESEVKRKLVSILEQITNGVVEITSLSKGRELVSRINEFADSTAYQNAKGEERLNMLRDDLGETLLSDLAGRFSAILKADRPLWKLEHTPATKMRPPSVNLRRAFLIGRLFCEKGKGFPSAKKILESATRNSIIPSTPSLATFCKLGVCNKVTGGVRVSHPDLLSALSLFGVDGFIERAEAVFRDADPERISAYVGAIQDLDGLTQSWFDSLECNIGTFCDAEKLGKLLLKNFENYSLLMAGSFRSYEPWIFRRILDVIRASRAKHFCIGVPTFDALFAKRGMQPLRFSISEYLAGRKNLSVAQVEIIAVKLARELDKERSFLKPARYGDFFAEVARSELTQRFFAYRGIHPAQSIIRNYHGVDISRVTPSILQEIGVSGAGDCMAEIKDGSLSMVQNASQSGVGHKVNEVVGRAGLLCLQRKRLKGSFVFSFDPEIRERVLYVDGPWKMKDLEAVASGAFTQVISID